MGMRRGSGVVRWGWEKGNDGGLKPALLSEEGF